MARSWFENRFQIIPPTLASKEKAQENPYQVGKSCHLLCCADRSGLSGHPCVDTTTSSWTELKQGKLCCRPQTLADAFSAFVLVEASVLTSVQMFY